MNFFAGDKVSGIAELLTPAQKAQLLDELMREAPVGREIDLGKPVIVPYRFKEFPKMVYHHDSGHVLIVKDEKEEKAAVKRGFQEEPSPDHDYSKIVGGRAAVKALPAVAPEELSADELAELDAADEEES